MPRTCPICAHQLEVVRTGGEKRYACPACWSAWLPRPGALRFASGGPTSRMTCPQCEGPRLIGGGRTIEGDLWRCPACGGVLIALSPAPTPLPPETPFRVRAASAVVEYVAWVAIIVAEIAAG
ncbi:MAG: hypothetical protein KC544_15120 [Gemmatimonadetes bacterium]|nr:hypothetical protein [Gemmatimonadota bacterium]HPF61150.1 hypothetical protein [Gemmatimonadales bacterium]